MLNKMDTKTLTTQPILTDTAIDIIIDMLLAISNDTSNTSASKAA